MKWRQLTGMRWVSWEEMVSVDMGSTYKSRREPDRLVRYG
jgi:hypothetical protein